MKHLIKNTFIWFIIIGTISWATAYLLGSTTPTFINTYTANYGTFTKTLYYLDVHRYLLTLQRNIEIPIAKMFYDPPTLPKIDFSDILSILKGIPNLFIWWLNQLIWWFNIIIFVPIKLLCQPIILILTIIGIDLEKFGIITFVYKIYELTPPIINYI